MFGAIFILFLLPILDTCRIRGAAFRPLLRLVFWLFVGNFLLLLWLGSQHAAEPDVPGDGPQYEPVGDLWRPSSHSVLASDQATGADFRRSTRRRRVNE